MNIILGASGQVGSFIVRHLHDARIPVKAVVRKKEAHEELKESGIESDIADFFDKKTLEHAFKGGDTLFVITPENPFSPNIHSDTITALENIKHAVAGSTIKRIVGLSSIGAQHSVGTGNLTLSYLLEHIFSGLPLESIFIRPAYYYSNWLGYLDVIREHGVLPTFFPADLKIPMTAPADVARFISDVIINKNYKKHITEVMGPDRYSSRDIAEIYGKVLNTSVFVSTIPEKDWVSTFLEFGATKNYANSLVEMTKAVIDGRARAESPDEVINFDTGFEEYLLSVVKE